ncbi:hypothetical protein O988_01761 [Pseudogymnoascus sp. VKM F-3808]|nr:hypothetical protein O988_01761 [Pseudogymnoascus sp. VKM F-3808]
MNLKPYSPVATSSVPSGTQPSSILTRNQQSDKGKTWMDRRIATDLAFTSTVTRTYYRATAYVDTEINGGLVTSSDVITIRLASIPTGTLYEPVTYFSCIAAALVAPTSSTAPPVQIASTSSTAPSLPSSTVVAPTTTTAPLEASTDPHPGSHKTLVISATVGSTSIVCILAIALGFWMWRRNRKRKLDLVSLKELTEAAVSSHSPSRGMHRKFSFGTTITGTTSTNPTLVDYVGLMPSVSQRDLLRPATDIQSAVDTDWSNVRRSSVALPGERVRGVNSQYLRPKQIPIRPPQTRHTHTANYNSSYSQDGPRAVLQMPAAESYTSRDVRAQHREISSRPSQEHILMPTVYSPNSARSTGPSQERGRERPPSVSTYSQPDPDDRFPSSPSREWAWAEALRRLEDIHERRPVDFTRDPTSDTEVTGTQNRFDLDLSEGLAVSEEGDYETIIYESEGESRAQSRRGPGRDNTDESVFSVDAVLRRIANEPPRRRDRR